MGRIQIVLDDELEKQFQTKLASESAKKEIC